MLRDLVPLQPERWGMELELKLSGRDMSAGGGSAKGFPMLVATGRRKACGRN